MARRGGVAEVGRGGAGRAGRCGGHDAVAGVRAGVATRHKKRLSGFLRKALIYFS